MEKIGNATRGILDLAQSPRRSGHVDLPAIRIDANNLPERYVPETDRNIPDRLWSGIIPSSGRREIVRELTSNERGVLERRVAELSPALAPYRESEKDSVREAIALLFSSYRNMRQTGEEAFAIVETITGRLKDFPQWAISAACDRIVSEGYDVDDGHGNKRRERHWPPSDSEIIREVQKQIGVRGDALRSARALLEAPVQR